VLSAFRQFNPLVIAVIAAFLLIAILLWLAYCHLTGHRHKPEDAVRLIQAAGLYFPLRPQLPKALSRRGRATRRRP
jgi:hypothetical protein